MCGIVGIWNKFWLVKASNFDLMVDSLAHRGPDGRGTKKLDDGKLILGHRRLSIIDLSQAGSQPMANEDETVWLTFNGEIYNYVVLRRELEGLGHIFHSQTDSETIIHAYEEWGTNCVLRFRGIFAFGIYNCQQKSLFLARDHIGVKPLYYYIDQETFVFASQPKAILAAERFSAKINTDAFSLYLAYGNVPAEYCIYEGIKKLLPGHWLLLQDGKLSIQKYWNLRYTPIIHNFIEAENVVRAKIEECVNLQAVSDVSIGTLLSGGVDSTIITSLLVRQGYDPLSSFNISFSEKESDESIHAKLVAKYFKTQHYESLLTRSKAFSLIADIVEAYDEPFDFNGLFPYYAISSLVQSKGIKVVFGGDGADEIFSGYLWYESFINATMPVNNSWRSRLLEYLKFDRSSNKTYPLHIYFKYNGFFNPDAQSKLTGPVLRDNRFDKIYLILEKYWDLNKPRVLAAQFLDFNCFLADHCLTKVDRASMACGVEVRVPFLDIELVELIFSIDHDITFNKMERKALLKRAMKSSFPTEMDINRKKGFSSPLSIWLSHGLAEASEKALLEGSLCSRGLISHSAIKSNYSQMNSREQLLLISAELWCRRWIENDLTFANIFVESIA